MPSILTRQASIKNLSNFVIDARQNKSLYFSLGRSTTWGGAAPQPAYTIEEVENLWTDMIGIKRITIKDLIPIVPRRTWTSAQTYVAFDSTSMTAFDDAFYIVNSNSEVFTVTTAGGGTSTVEPLLANAVSGVDTTSDGYTWQYEYTCNPYEINQVPSNWLSVVHDDVVDTTDVDVNANVLQKLGTKYLLVLGIVSDPAVSSEFAVGEFRQISLISNPLLSGGTPVTNVYEPIANLLANSGYVIHIENHEPYNIVNGQGFHIQFILRF